MGWSPGGGVSPFGRDVGLMGGGEGRCAGVRALGGIVVGGSDECPRGDGAIGCLKELERSFRGDCTGVDGPDGGVSCGDSRELMSISWNWSCQSNLSLSWCDFRATVHHGSVCSYTSRHRSVVPKTRHPTLPSLVGGADLVIVLHEWCSVFASRGTVMRGLR